MDDSWRMRIGMTEERRSKKTIPRRRSTEATWTLPHKSSSILLGPEDFRDVFGGPPRTVLSRQFSATSSDTLSEELFQPRRIGRERSDGFYNDMFPKTGSNSISVSKSKSNSSSMLSAEGLSPFHGGTDVSLSPFSFKLRPIDTQDRWSSSASLNEEQQWQYGPEFSTNDSSYLDSLFIESNFINNFKNSLNGFSRNFNFSSAVDAEVIQEQENYDDVISSNVSENGRDNIEEVEDAVGIDEAIIWAKGKFLS